MKSTKVFEDINLITEIKQGLVAYVGIEIDESEAAASWLIKQLSSKINESDEILILSQFTLLAKFKGTKPSFHLAESNEKARVYFFNTVLKVKEAFPGRVKSGLFGRKLEIVMFLEKPNIELITTLK